MKITFILALLLIVAVALSFANVIDTSNDCKACDITVAFMDSQEGATSDSKVAAICQVFGGSKDACNSISQRTKLIKLLRSRKYSVNQVCVEANLCKAAANGPATSSTSSSLVERKTSSLSLNAPSPSGCQLCNLVAAAVKNVVAAGNSTLAAIEGVAKIVCLAVGGGVLSNDCNMILDEVQSIANDVEKGLTPADICVKMNFCSEPLKLLPGQYTAVGKQGDVVSTISDANANAKAVIERKPADGTENASQPSVRIVFFKRFGPISMFNPEEDQSSSTTTSASPIDDSFTSVFQQLVERVQQDQQQSASASASELNGQEQDSIENEVRRTFVRVLPRLPSMISSLFSPEANNFGNVMSDLFSKIFSDIDQQIANVAAASSSNHDQNNAYELPSADEQGLQSFSEVAPGSIRIRLFPVGPIGLSGMHMQLREMCGCQDEDQQHSHGEEQGEVQYIQPQDEHEQESNTPFFPQFSPSNILPFPFELPSVLPSMFAQAPFQVLFPDHDQNSFEEQQQQQIEAQQLAAQQRSQFLEQQQEQEQDANDRLELPQELMPLSIFRRLIRINPILANNNVNNNANSNNLVIDNQNEQFDANVPSNQDEDMSLKSVVADIVQSLNSIPGVDNSEISQPENPTPFAMVNPIINEINKIVQRNEETQSQLDALEAAATTTTPVVATETQTVQAFTPAMLPGDGIVTERSAPVSEIVSPSDASVSPSDASVNVNASVHPSQATVADASWESMVNDAQSNVENALW